MVNFGIIGYGNIGKRHAKYISENTQAKLIAIFDNDENACKDAKQSFPEVSVYNNLSDFLNHREMNVVNVCSPNYMHASHSIAAVESGYNVLCEKPMSTSTIDSQKMIDAANKNNKKIFVVKQNRYNSPISRVKKLIDENALGELYLASIHCYWNRDENYYKQSDWRGDKQKDGGCLFTQFSHFVDIMYYLFGDVEVLYSCIENKNHKYINTEDQGTFVLKNKKNLQIQFSYSVNAYKENMEGSLTILAEKGSIKIGGKYLNEMQYAIVENENIELIKEENNNVYTQGYQGSMSHHPRVIQNVIDTLKGRSQAMTNAEEGKKVVEIIEKMYGNTPQV